MAHSLSLSLSLSLSVSLSASLALSLTLSAQIIYLQVDLDESVAESYAYGLNVELGTWLPLTNQVFGSLKARPNSSWCISPMDANSKTTDHAKQVLTPSK